MGGDRGSAIERQWGEDGGGMAVLAQGGCAGRSDEQKGAYQ
jgi:hypothetical protein